MFCHVQVHTHKVLTVQHAPHQTELPQSSPMVIPGSAASFAAQKMSAADDALRFFKGLEVSSSTTEQDWAAMLPALVASPGAEANFFAAASLEDPSPLGTSWKNDGDLVRSPQKSLVAIEHRDTEGEAKAAETCAAFTVRFQGQNSALTPTSLASS